MEQSKIKNSAHILHKIENIEKEITELKLSVLKNLTPSAGNNISLKGILKGANITERDIAAVKKSIYSKTTL